MERIPDSIESGQQAWCTRYVRLHASAVAQTILIPSSPRRMFGQSFCDSHVWNSIPLIVAMPIIDRACFRPCHSHLERIEMILAEFRSNNLTGAIFRPPFRAWPVAGKMFQRNGNMMIADKENHCLLEAEDRGHYRAAILNKDLRRNNSSVRPHGGSRARSTTGDRT